MEVGLREEEGTFSGAWQLGREVSADAKRKQSQEAFGQLVVELG